jgi:hypothetical protein
MKVDEAKVHGRINNALVELGAINTITKKATIKDKDVEKEITVPVASAEVIGMILDATTKLKAAQAILEA